MQYIAPQTENHGGADIKVSPDPSDFEKFSELATKLFAVPSEEADAVHSAHQP